MAALLCLHDRKDLREVIRQAHINSYIPNLTADEIIENSEWLFTLICNCNMRTPDRINYNYRPDNFYGYEILYYWYNHESQENTVSGCDEHENKNICQDENCYNLTIITFRQVESHISHECEHTSDVWSMNYDHFPTMLNGNSNLPNGDYMTLANAKRCVPYECYSRIAL